MISRQRVVHQRVWLVLAPVLVATFVYAAVWRRYDPSVEARAGEVATPSTSLGSDGAP